ncbi:hypothetical protein LSTR_LSTR000806 [Laodelphax striatellus]|uniref:Uncharacterized protein n=1 Tax=Laodelphax striatellus TaxID=195883 RepID=A0A482XGT5_LAOST|nr:hypothetical protein LSTR_LSTR016006 [Laodelphax striatellus]RZF44854.1 hypothetical protein LSTR_LSTR000806 [Laodelphax striatellus]
MHLLRDSGLWLDHNAGKQAFCRHSPDSRTNGNTDSVLSGSKSLQAKFRVHSARQTAMHLPDMWFRQ